MNGDDKQEMKLKMAARSANQENLIQRVQWLTKENEKLRGVLVQNDKMLKPSQEEVLGDADLKEKYLRVKKQLWKYQERENNLQDKENALLEKEEACTQKLVKQGKDLQCLLAEVRMKEEALTQEKQRHEEEIKILGETHEHEVLLLKEDLHTKSQAMAAVQTNENCLREQLLKLQLENQNLSVECEKCRADCTKQEEETQSVKRQSETHQQKYLLLKEQLLNKELALETSQTSEEHLKEQVTQLIQENETLGIELERHKDDLWQLKERYKYDRHKVIQNSNHQRNIIETLKSQLAITQTELDNSQAHIDKNDVSIRDLQSKLEQLRALLENEKAHTQKLLKQGKDLQRQLAEVRVKEEALTQEKQRHEEEIKILKKQLGETQEHKVLLKEALAAVQTNEKFLRDQLVKLQLENQNLSVECEKCRADCKKQEEETQSVKRQLSETHKKEYLLLKEQLRNKELALETSQTSEEHMKAQVTQLIQKNDSLGIELERLEGYLQQQEEMYQYHCHKVRQDSEHQRNIIEKLKAQLAFTQIELHNSRAHIAQSNARIRDLQSKLEQLWAEYQLVESDKYHLFMSQHWASQQTPMPSADHLPPYPAVSMSQQPSPAVPQMMCQPQQMQFNQPMCPPVYSMPPAVSVPSMI